MPIRVKIVILAVAAFLGFAGWRGLNALAGGPAAPRLALASEEGSDMPQKIRKSEKEWKAALTPEQFDVMRKCSTERPFTGKYNDFWDKGVYVCAGCGEPLFRSEMKYEHGTGWPSFSTPVDEKAIDYRDDYSLLAKRIEVRCAKCGAHLGHVFDDGPGPTFLHYCVNSASLDFKPEAAGKAGGPEEAAAAPTETATFAAGCFWGVEYKLGKIPGVVSTVVGYTGGKTVAPTYEDVCTDKTGHAEAVQVIFDPAKVSYGDLVRQFFAFHDPTQVNKQGPDQGTQYRSAIFYHSEAQREAARQVMDELEKSGKYKKRLATELVPASAFYKAEEYHQKYFEKHGVVCY